MRTFFRKAAALTALLAVAVQPLGAWAYAPIESFAASYKPLPNSQAVPDFRTCIKKAMANRVVSVRDSVDRPRCYENFGKALAVGMTVPNTTTFSNAFRAAPDLAELDGLDSTAILVSFGKVQAIQAQADQVLAQRVELASKYLGPRVTLDQFPKVRADFAALQKALAAAAADPAKAAMLRGKVAQLAPAVAYLTRLQALYDRYVALSKQAAAELAKYGYSLAKPLSAPDLKNLVAKEKSTLASLDERAIVALHGRGVTALAHAGAEFTIAAANAIAYLIKLPGDKRKIEDVQLMVMRGAVFCIGDLDRCRLAILKNTAEGTIETANSLKIYFTQRDLFGRPVSDDEWSRSVLMLPVNLFAVVTAPLGLASAGTKATGVVVQSLTAAEKVAVIRPVLVDVVGATRANNLIAVIARGGAVEAAAAVKEVEKIAIAQQTKLANLLRLQAEFKAAKIASQAQKDSLSGVQLAAKNRLLGRGYDFSKVDVEGPNGMWGRGWTYAKIEEVLARPAAVKKSLDYWSSGGKTAESATAYFLNKNQYVVTNDLSKKIIQVSNLNNPLWLLDKHIK